MREWTLRTYCEGDDDRIAELTKVAWENATVWQRIEALYGLRAGKPWWHHKLRSILACAHSRPEDFVVAECEGRIVGYATFSLDHESKMGTVSNNAVDPLYRGRGIGSALHREVLRRIVQAGMEVIQVTTIEPLGAAQRMYERHGFKEVVRSITYLMSAEQARTSPVDMGGEGE